jgi:hypothetical protein
VSRPIEKDLEHNALRRPPSLAKWEDANCSEKKENELFDHLFEKQSLTQRNGTSVMNFGDYRSCGGELLSSHRQALAPVTTRLAPCVRAFLAPTGKCLAQMNNWQSD